MMRIWSRGAGILTVTMALLAGSAESASEFEDPAQLFADSITSRDFIKAYDRDALLAAVERFNQAQNARFGVEPCGRERPKGHHVVRLEDLEGYFILQFTITEEDHNDGTVDGGEDRFKGILFSKNTLEQTGEYSGISFGADDAPLRVVADGTENCAGYKASDYAVQDVRNGERLFSARLPDGTFRFQAEPLDDGRSFLIEALAQTLIHDPVKESQCELRYWAAFEKVETVLRCDDESRKCVVTRSSVERYEDCADIGGCD